MPKTPTKKQAKPGPKKLRTSEGHLLSMFRKKGLKKSNHKLLPLLRAEFGGKIPKELEERMIFSHSIDNKSKILSRSTNRSGGAISPVFLHDILAMKGTPIKGKVREPRQFKNVDDIRDTFFNVEDGYYELIGGPRYFVHIGEAVPEAEVGRIARQIAEHFRSRNI